MPAVALWWRRERESRWVVVFLAVYAASIIAFFVTARYRAPIRPLLGLLAVVGVVELRDRLRRGGVGAWGTALGLLGFGALVNLHPWLDSHRPSPAQFYQSVATIRHSQARYEDALAWQMRAFAADSTYPESNLNLGTLFMQLGRAEDAIGAFERERRLDPDDGRNLASLAQAFTRVGRIDEAEAAYQAAEETGFADAPALYNHAQALERLGRLDEAAARYRRAAALDTTFADAWNNLGVIAARQRRWEDARSSWEQALKARPGYEPALDNLRRLEELSGERSPHHDGG